MTVWELLPGKLSSMSNMVGESGVSKRSRSGKTGGV